MTIRLVRLVLFALVVLATALPMGGCGKRQGDLDPPKGAEGQYPKRYPSW